MLHNINNFRCSNRKYISSDHDFQEKITLYKAWGFQRESELLPIFNHWLKKMQQTGVIDRLHQKFIGDHKLDEDTTVPQSINGLDFENVALPFIALLIGLCAAVTQLAIEIVSICKKKCSDVDEQSKKELGSLSEEAKDVIAEINYLLLENHCKAEDLKFLSRMRVLSASL